jgi:hypothetical protein
MVDSSERDSLQTATGLPKQPCELETRAISAAQRAGYRLAALSG